MSKYYRATHNGIYCSLRNEQPRRRLRGINTQKQLPGSPPLVAGNPPLEIKSYRGG